MSQSLLSKGLGLLTMGGFGAYAYTTFSKGGFELLNNTVHASSKQDEQTNNTTKTSSTATTNTNNTEPESNQTKKLGTLLRRKTYNPHLDAACRPLIICGPSGAGKSTLIKKLVKEYPNDFGFSVSHTTRDPRTGEVDGIDYHFAHTDDMLDMIKKGKFIEHAHVHNRIYGTSVTAVTDVTKRRQICILDIDVQGVQTVMESEAHVELNPKYLFIRPVSVDVLEKRLISRATDSLQAIQNRVNTASFEMEVAAELPFDHVIVNDKLDKAYMELKEFIEYERSRCKTCRRAEEQKLNKAKLPRRYSDNGTRK